MKTRFLFNTIFIVIFKITFACQCPVIEWTKVNADKYEVIFRGVIKNIIPHQNEFTVAEMEVLNIFKGNPNKIYRVLFPENDECAIPLNVGEEWLIYGNSEQINSCKINWCGLSRKKFQNDIEDFFIATHIITYDEELNKLQNNFSEIKISETEQYQFHKNIIPDKIELYLYIALSLIGFLLILYLVKKYLK